MVRLTIIIPCLGPVEACEDTLVSALQNRPADCEIVVVHTQPYADPYDLRREVRFLVVSGQPDICTLVNSGLEVSSGEVIHLLSSDLLVSEGWTDSAMKWFQASAIGAVSPWLISRDAKVTAAGVGYAAGGRRWVVGGEAYHVEAGQHTLVGPTLRGAFYRRQALQSLGGLPSEVGDELADVDVALSLRKAGWKIATEPCCRLTDTRTNAITTKQGWRAGRQAERLFFRHAVGAERTWAYLSHPWSVALELLKQFPRPAMLTQLAGRFAAWLELGSAGRYATQLATAQEQFEETQERENSARVKIPLPRKTSIPLPGTALDARRRAA